MKREFLQNIKVGDAALPKEVIDLIMEENGRDIEATKGKFSDYDTIKAQLSEAQATIQGFKDQGQDIEAVRAKATEWENKYNQAIAAHAEEKAENEFMADIAAEINRRKGRNKDAIIGALGKDRMDALRKSKNRREDIKSEFDAFEKDNAYLFGEDSPAPPPYAPGAGSQNMGGTASGVEAAFAALNPGLKLD